MRPALLQVRDLHYCFPDGTAALTGAHLMVERGTLHILAGPNGSGKTVLMKHCNGLLKGQAGEVLLEGQSIWQNIRKTRERVGLVFQNADAQIVGQTVEADIRFGLVNLGRSRRESTSKAREIMALLGLMELAAHNPHGLSGGEKRRLALAGVMAMDPELIIMDEPFANLDWPGVKTLLHSLLALREAGHTLLLITHDLEKVLAHADTLSLMNQGQVGATGRPSDMLAHLESYGIKPPWGVSRPVESMTWL